MKLGARILKTGIAIMLALLLSELFQLPSPVFAGIAAIFAIQPTIYRSFLSIIEHIQGNFVGAIIAVVFVLLLGNDLIIVGIAAIIVITINLKLKIENTIGLSLVTLIVIMEAPSDDFIQFAIIRFSTIMLGIISAFIVNLVFLPPKYETKLYGQIADLSEEIIKWIRLSIRQASEYRLLKNDISRMKETMIKLDQLYLLYKEERNYFKKDNTGKQRKLVIYRQMILTSKRSLEILRRLHRFENDLTLLSEPFQNVLRDQLDYLMNHHEELILGFIGKVKITPPDDHHQTSSIDQIDLFEQFLLEQRRLEAEENSLLYHTMQLVSDIIEYGEYVNHLHILINSFHTFHKKENMVTIETEE